MKINPSASHAYQQAQKSSTQTKPSNEAAGAAQTDASSKSKKGIDTVDLGKGITAEWMQKALMTEIGNKIGEKFGEVGVDLASAAGLDWSPEGVSQRIFNFTTAFFESYKADNPEMSEEEAIDGFEKLVRGSVDEGFEEAMEILNAFEANQEIKNTAQETMTLLHEKYDAYFQNLREGVKEKGEEAK